MKIESKFQKQRARKHFWRRELLAPKCVTFETSEIPRFTRILDTCDFFERNFARKSCQKATTLPISRWMSESKVSHKGASKLSFRYARNSEIAKDTGHLWFFWTKFRAENWTKKFFWSRKMKNVRNLSFCSGWLRFMMITILESFSEHGSAMVRASNPPFVVKKRCFSQDCYYKEHFLDAKRWTLFSDHYVSKVRNSRAMFS